MAKYFISHKTAGRQVEPQKALEQIAETLNKLRNIQIISDSHRDRPRQQRRLVLFESEARDLSKSGREGSDVIIEPEIIHRPLLLWRRHEKPAAAGSWCVQATYAGQPLEGAEVVILFQSAPHSSGAPPQLSKPQRTGPDGGASVALDPTAEPKVVRVVPAGGFWSTYRGRRLERHNVLDCAALPQNGPLEWWHHADGCKEYDAERGKHARIGILGTGVGPHPCLNHVELVDKKPDISDHETFVCGLISARPKSPHQFAGIAPGANVFSMRIYDLGEDGEVITNQGRIAHAIDFM